MLAPSHYASQGLAQLRAKGSGRVGDAGNQGFGVSIAQMTEFDGRMSALDQAIEGFSPKPTPMMTPDQFASAAAADVSLKLRWGAFHPSWEAWRDAHVSSLDRVLGSSAVEFGQFETQYNGFRNEFIGLGGTPPATAPPADTEAPKTPDGWDKALSFLNSAKWILALGLGAYVIVETGVAKDIGDALHSGKST